MATGGEPPPSSDDQPSGSLDTTGLESLRDMELGESLDRGPYAEVFQVREPEHQRGKKIAKVMHMQNSTDIKKLLREMEARESIPEGPM